MPVVHNAMMLIKPSSVDITGAGSSATINESGSVTFSACATLSLNGVFSSTYDNYVIDIRHKGSTLQALYARMRASATDNTTANSYVRQRIFATSTTVSGERATSNLAFTGAASATQQDGLTLYVYGPYLAQPTAARSVTVYGEDSARIFDCAWTHNQSTSYDGFTLGMNVSGTFTGLIKVYGLRQ
jgi:hypothetical protein